MPVPFRGLGIAFLIISGVGVTRAKLNVTAAAAAAAAVRSPCSVPTPWIVWNVWMTLPSPFLSAFAAVCYATATTIVDAVVTVFMYMFSVFQVFSPPKANQFSIISKE